MKKKFQFSLFIQMAIGFFLVSALLTARPVLAATSVGGVIAQNTTWTKEGSPYIVTGNLLIPQGVTLAIEPGVQVRFNGTFDGNEGPGCYLVIVLGQLIARGTAEQRILLTSNSATPKPQDWGTIVFAPSSGHAVTDDHDRYVSGSIISYAEISYGGSIHADQSSPYIAHNYIHDTVSCSSLAWGPIDLNVSHSIVKRNLIEYSSHAINSFASNAKFIGNVIRNNWRGFRIYGSKDIIQGNLISGNKGNSGVHDLGAAFSIHGTYGYANPDVDTSGPPQGPRIEQNCIVRNGNQPLHPSAGLNIAPAIIELDDRAVASFVGNEISGNGTITDRNRSFLFYITDPKTSPGVVVHGNNIHNNIGDYDAYLYSYSTYPRGGQIDMTSNYWGGLDADQVETRIHDFNDDFFYEDVVVDPVLTEAFPVPKACLLGRGLTPQPSPTSSLTATPSELPASGGRVLVSVTGAPADLKSLHVNVLREGKTRPKQLKLKCRDGVCQRLYKVTKNRTGADKTYQVTIDAKDALRATMNQDTATFVVHS